MVTKKKKKIYRNSAVIYLRKVNKKGGNSQSCCCCAMTERTEITNKPCVRKQKTSHTHTRVKPIYVYIFLIISCFPRFINRDAFYMLVLLVHLEGSSDIQDRRLIWIIERHHMAI